VYKVSVAHYLNKQLKPTAIKEDGTKCFPVYIRVLYRQELNRICSEIVRDNQFCSEAEFNNPKTRLEIEYEAELIQAFFEYAVGIEEEFKISTSCTKLRDFLNWFNYGMCMHYEPLSRTERDNEINKIIKYLADKSGQTTTLLNNIINTSVQAVDFFYKEDLSEFEQMGILDKSTLDKLRFYYLLEDYEKKYFGSGNSWGANQNFNLLEWTKRGGKNKFIFFAKKSRVLSSDDILHYIAELEGQIRFDFDTMANVWTRGVSGR